jgi:uncharacterized phiE125 gp8 family phage protein
MALSLVTAPPVEPLTLAQAKRHLRVDATDEDDLIADQIQAAREFAEVHTHRAFITQTWDWQLDGFPWAFNAPMLVPKPPLQSVTSIVYVDTNGVTQTWDPTLYTVDNPQGPYARAGRILPNYFQIYPVTRDVPAAVTVRFVCGYAATATAAVAATPAGIKSGLRLLVGNWWLNREAGQIIRGSADILPFGVDALLWPFKAF